MRKNFLLLSIAFAIFTMKTNAQKSDTSFGIQVGTNLARYTPRFPVPSTEDVRYTGKIGFYAGGFVNFKICEQLRIQPSLLFASQGSKFKNENVEIRDNDFNVSRLDFGTNIVESTIILPVVLQIYLGEKFYIEAGPQIGYIISLKDKNVGDILPGTGNSGSENLSNNDKLDLGLLVGFGYKLNKKLGLNSRYYFGVIERNNGLKSSVLNLGIEYSF